MLLNLNFIIDDLREYKFKGTVADPPSVAMCRMPLYVDSFPEKVDLDILYILDAGALPSKPPRKCAASFVCLGTPPERWLDGSFNMAYTNEGVSAITALNAIVEEFSRYQSWTDKLSAAVTDGMPVTAIGRLASDMFGNPTVAQGTDYGILFYSLPTDFSRSTLLENYVKNVYEPHIDMGEISVPLEAAVAFSENPTFMSLESETEPVIFEPDTWGKISKSNLSFRSLMLNCFSGDRPLVRIIVDEVARPILSKDFVLIQVLRSYLMQSLRTESMATLERSTRFDRICDALLTGETVPNESIESALSKTGWHRRDYYFLVLLRERRLKVKFSAKAQVALLLCSRTVSRRYHVADDRVIIVVNLSVSDKTRQQHIQEIEGSLANLGLIATFGNPFSPFSHMPQFYEQAVAVEQSVRKSHPEVQACLCEDFMLDFILAEAGAALAPDIFLTEDVRRLVEYDRSCGTQLVALLRAYLDENCNIAHASRKLFMHRNTFLYQLEKMKSILQSDLDDADIRLRIQIALRELERYPDVLS